MLLAGPVLGQNSAFDQVNKVQDIPPATAPADSVFQIKAPSRAAIANGQGEWVVASGSGSGVVYDDWVGAITQTGTDIPVAVTYDNWDNEVSMILDRRDPGVYSIQINGFNYATDKLVAFATSTSVTPGITINIAPTDVFEDPNDALFISIFDVDGAQTELSDAGSLFYLEIRIYPD